MLGVSKQQITDLHTHMLGVSKQQITDLHTHMLGVSKQQITDLHTRMLGVSKHIDECAAGLTPQFTIFPFHKILRPSEDMRKNKERLFILKYKHVLNDALNFRSHYNRN